MKAEDHPEYASEQANLQRTLTALAARLEALVQANLITAYEDAAEALLAQYRAEYRALQNVSHSPYFARIDFVPYDEEQAGTHYIGKKGFEHDDDAVIDWRAPLAALFYRGKAGAVNYPSPAGPIRGLMQLKRNLDIRSQQLAAIADDFDIRETRPGDRDSAAGFSVVEPGEYLREKLAARHDPYLQDIIATIQAQQYELIQADAKQVLVVQGVAGSGKTSVALHRLAYLLHPGNADGIEAKRCVVFGPNRLFLSYIALVLPDLDIGQVTQTTFVEWTCEQLGLGAHSVVDETLDAILSPELPRDARVAHYRRSQLRNSHKRSYRTTYEITVFANAVLQSLAQLGRGAGLAEPFDRHGEAPQLHRLDDESELPKAIADSVSQIRRQGYENIAVITKTVDASVNLAVALYDYLEAFEVIETAEVEYRGGLVILPVHLAKGMEFEATLVVGVDESGYTATEYDGRLLYVAITRALHVLHLFWVGAIGKHLESAVSAAPTAG